MIKTLRRRFICGGMLALLILLTLLITSLGVVSYININNEDEAFISSMLSNESFPQTAPLVSDDEFKDDRFYNRGFDIFRRSFYTVSIDPSGTVTGIDAFGIWKDSTDSAEALIEEALATHRNRGHLSGMFRFGLSSDENGTKLILVDDYQQYHTLLVMLRTMLLFALIALVTMFLILLPVSAQMIRSYAVNAEKQKQFITNAGHELKTPLAIILSNVDAMELIAGENKWSKNIREQTGRLSALVYRLLFMARLDEGNIREKPEKVNLSELLRAEITAYSALFEEKQLSFSDNVPDSQEIFGYREYISQLVHVIMDNAMQYTPAGGQIQLSVSRQKHRTVITIENSVSALPDCAPDQLFERFYRGDSAHSQSGGHGIGLSAAKAIAEMHHGTVRAEYGELSVRFIVEMKGLKKS